MVFSGVKDLQVYSLCLPSLFSLRPLSSSVLSVLCAFLPFHNFWCTFVLLTCHFCLSASSLTPFALNHWGNFTWQSFCLFWYELSSSQRLSSRAELCFVYFCSFAPFPWCHTLGTFSRQPSVKGNLRLLPASLRARRVTGGVPSPIYGWPLYFPCWFIYPIITFSPSLGAWENSWYFLNFFVQFGLWL